MVILEAIASRDRLFYGVVLAHCLFDLLKNWFPP